VNVLVVDTSSWISYLKGQRNENLDQALKEGRVYLAPIVAAELISGAKTQRHQKHIADFLKDLPICDHDLDHWIRVGELRATLMASGFTMSIPDAHIAQCTLDLNGYLMSEDAIFTKVAALTSPRLRLLGPS